MKYILTTIIAKRLENGWQCEVSFKAPEEEIIKVRQFILPDINTLPAYLQKIEANQQLG